MEPILVMVVVLILLVLVVDLTLRLVSPKQTTVLTPSSTPPQEKPSDYEWLVAECTDAYELETALDDNASEGWELYGIYVTPKMPQTLGVTGPDLADPETEGDAEEVETSTEPTEPLTCYFTAVWFKLQGESEE